MRRHIILSLLGSILMLTSCATGGGSALALREPTNQQAILAQEPFSFEKEFPVAPGMKLAHHNIRDDDRYYSCELQYQGTISLEALEQFYVSELQKHGLQVVDLRREDNSISFRATGWPESKLVTLVMFDHSMIPRYPDMVYTKTDHPSMQHRSVTASISKRKDSL
jgi:hypothetical protein